MVDRKQRLDQIAMEIRRLMLNHAIAMGGLLNEAKEIHEDLARLGSEEYTRVMAEAHLTLEEAKQLEILSAKGEQNLTKAERKWLIALSNKASDRAMRKH